MQYYTHVNDDGADRGHLAVEGRLAGLMNLHGEFDGKAKSETWFYKFPRFVRLAFIGGVAKR